MKKYRLRTILAGAACLYVLLLILLVLAERSAGDSAQIKGFGDAFWYSLVTLTTVGYGDLVPMTPAGRLIGILFSLMSLGIAALLIGILVSCLKEDIYPVLLFYRNRDRRWAVFAGDDEDAAKAAGNIGKAWPDAFLVTVGDNRNSSSGMNRSAFSTGRNVEGILDFKARHGKPPASGKDAVFILGKNDACNIELALRTDNFIAEKQIPCDICCRIREGKTLLPDSIRRFDEEEITARLFWMKYAVRSGEKRIIVIGPADAADSLLEFGLKVNILSPGQKLSYDVFCGNTDFLLTHRGLGEVCGREDGSLSVTVADESFDTVTFHAGNWREDAALLQSADRIVLCGEDLSANLAILDDLRISMGVHCPVYLRSAEAFGASVPEGVYIFGTPETVFTPEFMMEDGINRAARALHEIYRKKAGRDVPAFEDLSWFAKASNMAASGHLVPKLRILLGREDISGITAKDCSEAASVWKRLPQNDKTRYGLLWIEHIRWVRFHLMYNWRYAPVRDDEARLHPLLLPFAELGPGEQEKDAYAWEVLEKLADAGIEQKG